MHVVYSGTNVSFLCTGATETIRWYRPNGEAMLHEVLGTSANELVEVTVIHIPYAMTWNSGMYKCQGQIVTSSTLRELFTSEAILRVASKSSLEISIIV